jgi:hypothetical protein
MKWFTTNRRAYIYRVVLSVGAVLMFYGILSAEELAVWCGLVATILMVLPVVHTPTDNSVKNGGTPPADNTLF